MAAAKRDQMTLTLKPGQGAEVKMVTKQGAKVTFVWTTNGRPVFWRNRTKSDVTITLETEGDYQGPKRVMWSACGVET
ncbi:Uncharacterised protein [Bordetella ansorpii]|uniref:Uncharacterized protein n=2 Tax=Bordetella ansorpii TaxID=288768 RepID=A0A157RQ94_9BORD|nr:Uncharacterised protein [Bordetella ansorpii]